MRPRRAFRLLPPDTGLGWTPYAWLVYLPTFLISPILYTRAGQASVWMWSATIAALALFLFTYFRGFWVRGVRLIPIIATQAALGVAFAPINQGSAVLFVYAASFAAQLDRPRDGVRGVLLIATIAAATAVITSQPLFFWVTGVLVSLVVGGVNLHFHQAARAQKKLRLAHAEIEQLAAIAERERIARDLHDVLGHTLSLIVLKAELAVKLSVRDPDRAASEMRDVEEVARRMLQDVRHAIRGYRATLVEEVERSRSMLKASRITADIDVAPLALPPHVEETLALALREAVTNVVRHAGASRCLVRVSATGQAVALEVHDDGRGSAATPGLGLRGMRERVEEVGGELLIDGEGGMRVVATVPLGEAGEGDGEAEARASRLASAGSDGAPAPAPARGAAHPAGTAP